MGKIGKSLKDQDACEYDLVTKVRIAFVGKCTGLSDASLSILKASLHAYETCRKRLENYLVPACGLENETEKENPEAYRGAWKLLKVSNVCHLTALVRRNWNRNFSFLMHQVTSQIKTAVVGKYTGLFDAYLSVLKVNPDTAEPQEEAGLSYVGETSKRMESVDAIRVPRGLGDRGGLSFVAPDETGKRMEDKEDSVNSENATKNLRFICFINMTTSCIILLPLTFNIKSVFLDKAARFSFTSSCCSKNYAVPCPRSFDESTKFIAINSINSVTTVSPGKVQQVFVNFRGEELRYNFVSHLIDAFQRHGINFFIDKNEQRGKELKNLFVRIEESSIALAIFSTRYAESSWCMNELVMMKKLADQEKLRVIPIFYNVEAEDVRKPKIDSEFGQKFWRLAEVSSGDQIKNWKEALECISDKMGLSLGDKSSESDFVTEIVKAVQNL